MKRRLTIIAVCFLVIYIAAPANAVISMANSQDPTVNPFRKTGFLEFGEEKSLGTTDNATSPMWVGFKTSISEPAIKLRFPEMKLFDNERAELLERSIQLYGTSGKNSRENSEKELSESGGTGMRVMALVSGSDAGNERDDRLLMEILPEGGNSSGVIWQRSDRYSLIAMMPDNGIGGIRIKRIADAWPREIIVRLALKGLESLKIADADSVFHWEVSSYRPYGTTLSFVDAIGNTTHPLAREKGYGSLSIKSETVEIPLSSGYFEFTIPSRMLERTPQSISVQWIDFYRN